MGVHCHSGNRLPHARFDIPAVDGDDPSGGLLGVGEIDERLGDFRRIDFAA
jgi:hypothetical protein